MLTGFKLDLEKGRALMNEKSIMSTEKDIHENCFVHLRDNFTQGRGITYFKVLPTL